METGEKELFDNFFSELKKFLSEVTDEKENIFYTRNEAQEHYKFSKREVDKIFNTILKDKVVDIGKCQRLAKKHIDKLLTDGVKLKHI